MKNETKQAFQDRMEAEVKQRRAEIDELKAKAEQAEAEARLGLNENIRDLKKQTDEIQQRLDNLKSSSSEGWEEIKEGIASSWGELSKSFQKAREKF